MKLGVRIDGGDAMASTFSRLGRTEGLAKAIETCAEDMRERAFAEFGSGMLGAECERDLTDGGQSWCASALDAAQPRIDARLGDWLTRAVKAASGG